MIAEGGAGLVVIAMFFWIVQLCESCCGTTYKYLNNIEALNSTGVMINNLKRTRPEITFKIQNWHMETRTKHVTYKDQQGHVRHRVEHVQEKVNTHKA